MDPGHGWVRVGGDAGLDGHHLHRRRSSDTGLRVPKIWSNNPIERLNREWWDRHIRFRDWSRAHPEDRDRYAALKRSLATEHRNDRDSYTEGKSAFIASVVESAKHAP